jgi:hypothetical protein
VVLVHHLLHLFRPDRVLPGLHHLLMSRSHLMVLGRGLRDSDARDRDGERRARAMSLRVGGMEESRRGS